MSQSLEIADEAVPALRPIRSFVRRQGRMTTAQQAALERLESRYALDSLSGLIDLASAFGRVAPMSLEIGFGNGEALIARAQQKPERNHLGIEVHRPGVGRVLMQIESLGLTNVRVMSRDAVEVLREQIPAAALSELVIEFPDPWHKLRHHKRRLIQPSFANLVVERLSAGGLLRLATDWEPYAEHMLSVLNATPGLLNRSADGRYILRPESRPMTRFERRGERLGHAVFDLLFQRC